MFAVIFRGILQHAVFLGPLLICGIVVHVKLGGDGKVLVVIVHSVLKEWVVLGNN